MLPPRTFLDHADRVLAAGLSEADLRRSISGFYYAVFHLLVSEAALQIAGRSDGALNSTLRRSAQHREMRRLCVGLAAAGAARPKPISRLFPMPLSADLGEIAAIFVNLQDAREDADYDLENSPPLKLAESCQRLAHDAFDRWPAVQADPDTHAFLVALLMHDRWGRRV